MSITHAAHTRSVTFLLDDAGVCVGVVAPPGMPEGFASARDMAERCIGAQYVASVDVTAPGGLVAMPREGAPLVFAAVSTGGRVALVRTGPLERFVTTARPCGTPRADSDAPVSTVRGPVAGEPARTDDADDEAEVVTLRPTLVPSLVPVTLPWGAPRPGSRAQANDGAPFSLRRRVSDVVPRMDAEDAPETEREQTA